MINRDERAKSPGASASAGLSSLPNQLTTLRLLLAFVLFFLIWQHYWIACFVLFILAAVTDWLDGYVARKWQLSSSLGRVYDPLVDKVLTGGTFVFLLEVRDTSLPGDAGLNAMMVTVILAREFLVTGLRGFLEERGVAFGADLLGKAKMVLQCAAILWLFAAFAVAEQSKNFSVMVFIRDLLNWSMVAATFASGVNYVVRAYQHLK